MRFLPVLALALAGTAGCGAIGSGSERACTAIGAPTGIGVDVAAPFAARVGDEGTLVACWAGSCRSETFTLSPSTTAVDDGCTGDDPDDVCSARMRETGGKHGFAELSELPTSPVRVTLTLPGLERTVEVTPAVSYPNGADCPPGGAQAGVVVDASGAVRQR